MSENDAVGSERSLTRFIENNSESPKNQPPCPRPVGFFKGVEQDGNKLSVKSGNVACKRWNCPVCGPKRGRNVRWRILNGEICQAAIKLGYRSIYNIKFLTLTYPGREYREAYTASEAYDQMSSHCSNLIDCLKKRHGNFKYFRVYEKQRDGYPHFHILLVGEAISHRGILQEIEDLWREEYGMGFVNIRTEKFKSVEHSVRYLTKYLMKCPESVKKGSRIFSSSYGALVPIVKPKKLWVATRFEHRGAYGGPCGEWFESPSFEIDWDHILSLCGGRGKLSQADYMEYYQGDIEKFYLLSKDFSVGYREK